MIYNFAAGLDDGIWVAICLEHDLVTQADSADEVKVMAADMLRACAEADREEGLSMSTRRPPPVDDVADIEALPMAFRFTVEVEL